MVNIMHMRWCRLVMYSTGKQADGTMNRLIWNEKNKILWLCIPYSYLSSSYALSPV